MRRQDGMAADMMPHEELMNGKSKSWVLLMRQRWSLAIVCIFALIGPTIIQILRYEMSPQLHIMREAVGTDKVFNVNGLHESNGVHAIVKLSDVSYEINNTVGFISLRVCMSYTEAASEYREQSTLISPGELKHFRRIDNSGSSGDTTKDNRITGG